MLLLPAAILQIVGLRGNVAMIQGLSLILAVSGIVLHLYGSRVLLKVAFPLAFLLFMIPTLPWFIDVVSFELKLLAARGAVGVAHVVGVPVVREGVNLHFTDGVLAVENACSGLRSLMALLALGALFAYLATGPVWSRILLFLLALPIAVIANLMRVSGLCVYAGMAGVDKAAGVFHDIGGYVLFALAFVLLTCCKRILRC
jgi:exosortase